MITLWSEGPADENMPEEILVSTYERIRQHPWWQARASLALAVLQKWNVRPPARVLDVGCGWGMNLAALEKAGYTVSGLDVSRRILDLIDAPKRDLIQADLNQDIPKTALPTYDACLVLDVIEHLDRDTDALARIARLLRPGAIAMVSVPALPELFSDFDRIQGHRRRYLPETLRVAFEKTEFVIEFLFWWGAWMVPILRHTRSRMAAKHRHSENNYEHYLRLPKWPGPQLMKIAFAVEEAIALRGWMRTGTSLVAVARRS
jgi:2-polyprenyl-3-methyl-5-hydroxy-6-metoxy-1,4-benzoquinol methylase